MIKKPDLQHYLTQLQITDLNPIQEAALNASGSNLILLAPTGSGKTLAFLLPLLQRIEVETSGIQALIIVPSRELALQIEQVFKAMKTGFKITACYGGHSLKTESNSLLDPPTVLIGTPGRIADHLKRKNFDPSGIKTLILDEFDKSLELGFEDEMSFIIRRMAALEKRVLTSATNLQRLPKFAGIEDPVTLNFLDNSAMPQLEYLAIKSEAAGKLDSLFKLVCTLPQESILIFCNHREAVDRISDILAKKGVLHETFHGGLDQEERERALARFRNGSRTVLIATDLAARGLDIPEVRHVIHYQLPIQEDAFVHRNGRTGRMGSTGTIYLMMTDADESPAYLTHDTISITLPEDTRLPNLPHWETLHITGGRKDKINKVDLVGLLLKKGGIKKEELGLVEVKDQFSFAAVKRELAEEVASAVDNQKIKKKKVRVRVAR